MSGWRAMTSPVTRMSVGIPLRSDGSVRRLSWRDARGQRLQRGGHRGLDRAAGLGQALAGQQLRVREVAIAVRRAIDRLVCGLELRDDPGQALGDRVVDLARHPLPLVEDARLSCLGEQLGVEARVLLQGRLEPGERLAAFLALLGDLLAEHRAGADRDRLDADDREVERPRSAVWGTPAMSVLTRIELAAMPTTASGSGRGSS